MAGSSPRTSKSFTLATAAAAAEEGAEYPELVYSFTDPDEIDPKTKEPVVREIVAHYPGEGQILLVTAAVGMRGESRTNIGSEVLNFLSLAMSAKDFQFIKHQLQMNRLKTADHLMPLVRDMVESWSGFPSQP